MFASRFSDKPRDPPTLGPRSKPGGDTPGSPALPEVVGRLGVVIVGVSVVGATVVGGVTVVVVEVALVVGATLVRTALVGVGVVVIRAVVEEGRAPAPLVVGVALPLVAMGAAAVVRDGGVKVGEILSCSP
jgi:hypothetical protein